MSHDSSDRVQRTVSIPEHLWQCVELMAREMGGERDALISQALFLFARQNGYLTPGRIESAKRSGLTPRPGKGKREFTGSRRRPMPSPPLPGTPSDEETTAHPRTEVVDDSFLGADDSFRLLDEGSEPKSAVAPSPLGKASEPQLYLVGQDGALGRVGKERYIIGRGKHCDLVVHSSKVSREHAAIVHEGPDYYIEDLGSSNGTWFQKRRISRKKIGDGDEFFICSEKIKCVLKPEAK